MDTRKEEIASKPNVVFRFDKFKQRMSLSFELIEAENIRFRKQL
jgi:hypothetical protein